MSHQEQLELQNSSGATLRTLHKETAGCPAESPSKKGLQALPIRKSRRSCNHSVPRQGGTCGQAQQVLPGNQAWTETLHMFPNSIQVHQRDSVAVLCLIPTTQLGSTVQTETLQGLSRVFLFAAHVLDLDFPGGKCASPSFLLPAARRGVHRPGLADAWNGDQCTAHG